MKLGAVSTFLFGSEGVELLQACDAPAGMFLQVEPMLLSRKFWEEDRIVMVRDGVLDALPGEDKEQIMVEYLEGIVKRNPQNMAEEILEFAEGISEEVRDDLTVLVAGIWKKQSV